MSLMLRRMARETKAYVLSESTRAAIEKMAAEFAREMLADSLRGSAARSSRRRRRAKR
jgi:hypothetical protein